MNCVHHESFGGGDIKLVIPLGFLLGMENMLVCLVLSVLSGAGYALYRLFREHDGLKGSIPFGPFIAASALIALLYGDMLFPLYLSFARF